MAIEQVWLGTRAVRFENGGNTGAQIEVVATEADFATRTIGGQAVDNTGTEWQQVMAFVGAEGHRANLANGVDAADLKVGNGVVAHNIADLAGNGRVFDVTGTLDDADDPVALTGFGKASAGALGVASMEAAGSANRVVFSNDQGLGLINGSGTDSGGTANASRLNDGDAVNVEVRLGRVLSEATFTVKVRDGGSAAVVLDSDGRTIRDTNGSLQGGFVQDASAGELDLGLVAHSTRITIDYEARSVSIGGVAFTGNTTAFFDAFEAGGAKDLTLGSRVGSQNGWSADDLVLTTDTPQPEAGTAARFSGIDCCTVTEDVTLAAAATLTVHDPDAGEASFVAQAGTAGSYGTFAIGSDGAWTYKLANGSAAVQALKQGETVTDSFAVASADGSGATVMVTIHGTADAASFGGTAAGAVAEDGTPSAAGTLTVQDADAGEAVFVAQAGTAGSYGTFAIGSDGAWTYQLANGSAAVQALKAGETVTDSFAVASADGSTTTVAIVVAGSEDAAGFGGTATGSVAEDGAAAAHGTLTVSDPDAGQQGFVAQAATAGTHGSFTLDADGSWSYLLDNGAKVQALVTGQVVTDSFTVASLDGSTTTVTIEVHGADDAASFGGTATGAVREDTTLAVSGTLTVSDRDAGQAGFDAQAATIGTYGTFSIGADGAWSFLLDNLDAGVQALNTSQTVQEIFAVTSLDGSTTQVTISIQGLDETFLPAPSSGTGDPSDNLVTPAAPSGSYTTYGARNDSVNGNSSAEWVDGGAGNDTLVTGSGNDVVQGGDGNDRIHVGGGNDWANGGAGADSVAGGGGNDILLGGDGNDTLTGGAGSATLYGEAGNDSINGTPLIYGGAGNDSLVGSNTVGDTIHGGSGADTIRGRGGDDVIIGGHGADTLSGGNGADRFTFLSTADTGDVVTDWGSSDILDFSALPGTLTFKAAAGQSFSAQNQVAWYQDAADTYVAVDTDGILDSAELVVRLVGLHGITAADVVL